MQPPSTNAAVTAASTPLRVPSANESPGNGAGQPGCRQSSWNWLASTLAFRRSNRYCSAGPDLVASATQNGVSCFQRTKHLNQVAYALPALDIHPFGLTVFDAND